MLDVALEAGISPETLRKIESGRVATPARFTGFQRSDNAPDP